MLILNKTASFIDRMQLPILILSAPLFIFPSKERIIFMLIVPFLWGVAWIARGESLPRTPLNIALGMMLFMVFISLCASFDISFSLSKVAGLIYGAALYLCFVRWMDSPKRLWSGLQIFLLASGGIAFLGLFGASWIMKFSFIHRVVAHLPAAIRGFQGAPEGFNPNAIAGTLVFSLPLQALLLARGPRVWQPFWWGSHKIASSKVQYVLQAILLLLTGTVFLFTQSRGAWLGMAVGILAAFWWSGRRSRIVLAVFLMLGLASGLFLFLMHNDTLGTVIGSKGGAYFAETVQFRFKLWSRAISGIQDFPFTGMGMNSFRKTLPLFYPMFEVDSNHDFAHCHNHILQAALDLGIPGLAAYLSLWILTVFLLVHIFRRTQNGFHRTVANGLGIGLLAHFVFGLQDAIALGAKLGIMFWLALALVAGLYKAELESHLRSADSKKEL